MLKPTAKVKHVKFEASKGLEILEKSGKKAPVIRIGYPASKVGGLKYPDADVRVVDVAFWNEFGTRFTPERSFLRETMIEKGPEYRQQLKKIAKATIEKQIDLKKSMRKLGLVAVADVQEKITELKDPPNAPYTVARKKGSSNPLIDTAFMRNSTTFELRTGRNGRTKKD